MNYRPENNARVGENQVLEDGVSVTVERQKAKIICKHRSEGYKSNLHCFIDLPPAGQHTDALLRHKGPTTATDGDHAVFRTIPITYNTIVSVYRDN